MDGRIIEGSTLPSSAQNHEEWLAQSVVLGEEAAPAQVLIAPWGEVQSTNGRFVLDEAAGEAVLAAFSEHGTLVPIDYEHQSLGGAYASPSGQAPAAGWIRSLNLVRPEEGDRPGLYAEVEWTAAARARLLGREYRYLSPVLMVRRCDRRVMALHSVALTNKPAIVGLKPIVNRQDTHPPQADDDALHMLRSRLNLDDDCDLEVVLRTADRRLAELFEEAADKRAIDLVAAAQRAGKLAPAQAAWACLLAKKDPEAFAEWSASTPPVVSLGRMTQTPADRRERDRAAIVASARIAYRSQPALSLLTDEEAWVRQAVRDGGLDGQTHHAGLVDRGTRK